MCAVMLLAAVMAGCKSEPSEDLKDLLQTVPADATMVVTVNVESLLKHTGSKVSDGAVEPSADLLRGLDSIRDKRLASTIKAVAGGEAGIACTYAVVFVDGYYTYITGMLNDPAAFRKYVESNAGGRFAETGGVETCGAYAVKGNQFWVVSHSTIDPLTVKRFATFDDRNSFASAGYAARMLEDGHDIDFVADISQGMARGNLRDAAQMKLAMQVLFDDAAYLCGHAGLEKHGAEAGIEILDGKYKPARFNFPASEISGKTVRKVGESGDLFVAVALSARFMEKLTEGLSAFGPLADELLEPLKGLDGTAAFAVSAPAGAMLTDVPAGAMCVSGIVQTDGSPSAALTSMLGRLGDVSRAAGELAVRSATPPAGAITADEAAKALDDAMAGVVINPRASAKAGAFDCVRQLSLTLEPADRSLRLKAEARLADGRKAGELLLALLNL